MSKRSGNTANHARTFNSYYMPLLNQQWVSNILDIPIGLARGPDLIGEQLLVEVKFCQIAPYRRNGNYISWTVLNYQMRYPEVYQREGIWALGTYLLSEEIQDIPQEEFRNLEKLESFVLERQLWLVKWDWMNQFPFRPSKGKTKNSKWDNMLAYPKYSALPKTIETILLGNNKVHITEGV